MDRKSEFPIFTEHPELLYFDSAATAHKPRSVIEAISTFYAREYATVHRAIYRSAARATERYYNTREAARLFINAAHIEEIVFTRGTTDALNLIAQSYGREHLKAGDEILISELEHHSNLVPWQMLAEQIGVIIRWVPIDETEAVDVLSHIRPGIKLIAISHTSNVTGAVHPIAAIARAARRVGAIVVVDGAQAAPHQCIDVQALDADFYAFSGHKCYGPTGVGILYGKKALLESMPPVEGGGDMIDRVSLERTSYAASPLRFEAGTPMIGSVIALKAALDWMCDIGLDAIGAHEQRLLHRLEAGLRSIETLRILGPTASEKGPLCTFAIEGIHPLDLATLLDLKHIAIRSGHLCAQPALQKLGFSSLARASLGIYNTEEDVDRFCEELKKASDRLRRA